MDRSKEKIMSNLRFLIIEQELEQEREKLYGKVKHKTVDVDLLYDVLSLLREYEKKEQESKLKLFNSVPPKCEVKEGRTVWKCGTCGKEIEVSDYYCSICGRRVCWEDETTTD